MPAPTLNHSHPHRWVERLTPKLATHLVEPSSTVEGRPNDNVQWHMRKVALITGITGQGWLINPYTGPSTDARRLVPGRV